MKTLKQIAVALRYDESTPVPKVIASGRGQTAETIVALARKHDIPLHEDDLLAEMLGTLEIDEEIPEALYCLVAEVIAYVYQINEELLANPPS